MARVQCYVRANRCLELPAPGRDINEAGTERKVEIDKGYAGS